MAYSQMHLSAPYGRTNLIELYTSDLCSNMIGSISLTGFGLCLPREMVPLLRLESLFFFSTA